MKRELKKLALVSLGALGSLALSAQEAKQVKTYADDAVNETVLKYEKEITPEDLRSFLSVLAHDSLEGRETGMKGQKMAASYIEKHFRAIGLEGVNGKYQQSFPIVIENPGGTKFSVAGKEQTYIDDFFYIGSFEPEVIEASSFVFAGYGIDDKDYNDYSKIDVKDKIVVILSGEPKNSSDKYIVGNSDTPSKWSTDRLLKTRTLSEKGAKAVVVIQDSYDGIIASYRRFLMRKSTRLKGNKEKKERVMPFYFTKESVFGDDLASTIEKYKKGKQKGLGTINTPIVLDIKIDAVEQTGENVLGILEGTDLKDEILVITSHYDHIGISDDGQINNGANDDGSGTSAVMELAATFMEMAKAGIRPRRSILFMTVSGEEKGLLGSEYFTDNPLVPMNSIVCDLNIDMIGRVDEKHENNKEFIYVIGSDKLSTDLHKIALNINERYSNVELDFEYNSPDDPNRYYYRSDHYNFAKNNIPVIFYFNGTHPDYHKPTDTIEKIDFEIMSKVSQYIFLTAWEIANRNDRLKVDVENDFKNDR